VGRPFAARRADADAPGPADGRGRVAEPGVRLLAQGGRVAAGHAAGTAVARAGRTTAAAVRAALEAPQAVSRRPTSECRPSARN